VAVIGGPAHPLRKKRRLAPARGRTEQGELAGWFLGKTTYQGGPFDDLGADGRGHRFRGEQDRRLTDFVDAARWVLTGLIRS